MFVKVLEKTYVLILLLYSMGVAMALLYPDVSAQDVNSTIGVVHAPIAMIQVALYGFGGFLILTRWKRVLNAGLRALPLLVLSGLTLLSTLWSISPEITLRRSALLVTSAWVAVYLGERYSLAEIGRFLLTVHCMMIIATITLHFIAPRYVTDLDDHKGAWKGLSAHKNAFGEYMAQAALLSLLIRFRRLDWLRYLIFLMALVMLYLSHSMTSVVACAVTLCALPFWRLVRLPWKQQALIYLVGTVVFGAAAYLLTTNAKLLFQLLGRDATLTGRTEVWRQVIVAISRHPILGYGYAAFWTGLKGESLRVLIWCGWLVPEAHNGFLEICLAFGVVGAIVFLYAFVQVFWRAIQYVRQERSAIAFWPVSFLCFFVLHNLGESDILANWTISYLLFVAIGTQLGLQVRASRHFATEKFSVETARQPGVLVPA